jgi:hypothetical protein
VDLYRKEYNCHRYGGKKIHKARTGKQESGYNGQLRCQKSFRRSMVAKHPKGTEDSECPRNLYYLSQGYFSQRTAVMSTNSISIERSVTKGCPQVSCCKPGFWNLLYNSLLKLDFTSHSKVIAFADDLIILTKGESIVEA